MALLNELGAHLHEIVVHLFRACPFHSPQFPLQHAAADKQHSEMLIDNVTNLKKTVSEVLYATQAASIRVRPDSEATKAVLRWEKQK